VLLVGVASDELLRAKLAGIDDVLVNEVVTGETRLGREFEGAVLAGEHLLVGVDNLLGGRVKFEVKFLWGFGFRVEAWRFSCRSLKEIAGFSRKS
jgi:hypothetical protein